MDGRDPVLDKVACVPGELTLADGRCQPAGLPLDMPCAPGELTLADGRCQPAGVPAEACAAGFSADGRGGCEAVLPEDACPAGTMAVPGETACREIAPCGSGTWGDIPVEATTQYVDQSTPRSDGDGSMQRPWKTIQAGIAAAAPGAIVAIADGSYAEDLRVLDKQVRLWGRCPARVEVIGQAPQAAAAIAILEDGGSGSEVRGLAVTGPSVGVCVRGARSVTLERVLVHETGGHGAVAVDRSGEVILRGALLEQNREFGVHVYGAEATVEDTVVRDTQPDGAGQFGLGVGVWIDPAAGRRGNLSISGSLIERNHGRSVFVFGSDATIEDTVVRDTLPNGAGETGRGVAAEADPGADGRSKLSISASLIERNHEFGVFISGSDATIEDTVMRDTRPNGAGELGRGVNVRDDETTGHPGKLLLSASLIERNHDHGVMVFGSEATIETTVVRDTQPDGAGAFGFGIGVRADETTGEPGKLLLSASLIEQNRGEGVFVFSSEATIKNTVVRDTQLNGAGRFGRGVGVELDPISGVRGKLSLSGSLIERNCDTGVFVLDSDATIESTTVRDTRPDSEGLFGRGIGFQGDPGTGVRPQLSLFTSLIEQSQNVGVFVYNADATIEATAVRGTRLSRSPSGNEFGDGIMMLDDLGPTSATITDTEVTDSARAGVIYVGSTGAMSGVRSAHNRFGLVLQHGQSGARPTEGEGNAFESNTEEDRVSDGDLPVPDAAPPLP